jgi:hypothetical protein
MQGEPGRYLVRHCGVISTSKGIAEHTYLWKRCSEAFGVELRNTMPVSLLDGLLICVGTHEEGLIGAEFWFRGHGG